ncbi:MAG: DNA repair protein RecN [Desulfurivibrionaceae bacterium]
MLCELRISNLALIDNLTLSFADGLSVLTGETGAGKSIILQAISLLSGTKAQASYVRSGAGQCTIEALFEFTEESSPVPALLNEKGFEGGSELVLKRVITEKGRSRFYINGQLATGRLAAEISGNLLSVASQHDHQHLLFSRFHLDFIDLVGNLWEKRLEFTSLYDEWKKVKDDYERLNRREREKEQRKDFLKYQVKEIKEAQLTPGEDESLNREKKKLKSADDLNRLGRKSYSLLEGATGSLSQIRKNLDQMAELDPGISELAEKVAGPCYELEESLPDLRNYLNNIPDDPHELDQVMARLDTIQRLKRKYGNTLEEVIKHGEEAEQELAELEEIDSRIEKLHQDKLKLEEELVSLAQTLTRLRQEAARDLSRTIRNELSSLAFEQARFEIEISGDASDLNKITREGADRAAFMFSANPGEPIKPISQIASGGELSRLLLALKCMLARRDQVETVIFDEVDSGISGKAAESVARKIRELATHHQVICITHLPQIASYGASHYHVAKEVASDRTRTTIKSLSQRKRVDELARMLDGESISDQTLAYAEELIRRNTA